MDYVAIMCAAGNPKKAEVSLERLMGWNCIREDQSSLQTDIRVRQIDSNFAVFDYYVRFENAAIS